MATIPEGAQIITIQELVERCKNYADSLAAEDAGRVIVANAARGLVELATRLRSAEIELEKMKKPSNLIVLPRN